MKSVTLILFLLSKQWSKPISSSPLHSDSLPPLLVAVHPQEKALYACIVAGYVIVCVVDTAITLVVAVGLDHESVCNNVMRANLVYMYAVEAHKRLKRNAFFKFRQDKTMKKHLFVCSVDFMDSHN